MRGFTLLELMVATAVGSIVVGGVFFVMTNQTTVNRQQTELIEAQQNLRAAMTTVNAEIQMAGFGLPGKWAIGVTGSIDNVTGTDVYKTCVGTDTLQVQYREPLGFWRLQSATVSAITVAPGSRAPGFAGYEDRKWEAGRSLLLYPGFGKALKVSTTAAKAPSTTNATVALANAPEMAVATNVVPDSDVHLIQNRIFRVVCENDSAGNETRTLVTQYPYDLDGNGAYDDVVPIAADIEDMQVEFLYDTQRRNLPDDPPQKVTFPVTEDDVAQVKAIRVTMVSRSARPLQSNANVLVSRPYEFPGLRPAWPAPPGAAPYPILFRYGRRILREMTLLQNRSTVDPTNFSYISNRFL